MKKCTKCGGYCVPMERIMGLIDIYNEKFIYDTTRDQDIATHNFSTYSFIEDLKTLLKKENS